MKVDGVKKLHQYKLVVINNTTFICVENVYVKEFFRYRRSFQPKNREQSSLSQEKLVRLLFLYCVQQTKIVFVGCLYCKKKFEAQISTKLSHGQFTCDKCLKNVCDLMLWRKIGEFLFF